MTHNFFLIVVFSVLFFVTSDAQMDPSCTYKAKPPALNIRTPSLNPCKYRLHIQTGNQLDAGTDSKIGIRFDMDFDELLVAPFEVPDLTKCGIPEHDEYFQRNQIDRFELQGPCLLRTGTATLMSDGSGLRPKWYVESATLTVTLVDGLHEARGSNKIEKWLSPPDSLSAPVNFCARDADSNDPGAGDDVIIFCG